MPKDSVDRYSRFLKRYVALLSVAVAATPGPLGKLKLIPVYSDQSRAFQTYVSILCVLALALIYFVREPLAHALKGKRRSWVRLLPAFLSLMCFACALGYNSLLNSSLRKAEAKMQERGGVFSGEGSVNDALLEQTEGLDIAYATGLMALYIPIFVSAEAAIALMALTEYLKEAAPAKARAAAKSTNSRRTAEP